jgi:hypothetical protein
MSRLFYQIISLIFNLETRSNKDYVRTVSVVYCYSVYLIG